MTKINKDVVELVRHVYGDTNGLKTRSLDFRSESIRDFETFKAALRQIGQYNLFDPDQIIGRIESLWPNLMGVQIAREGSPALYLEIPYWSNQAIGWLNGLDEESACKLTDEQRHEIKAAIKDFARGCEADEIDEALSGMRVWWD